MISRSLDTSAFKSEQYVFLRFETSLRLSIFYILLPLSLGGPWNYSSLPFKGKLNLGFQWNEIWIGHFDESGVMHVFHSFLVPVPYKPFFVANISLKNIQL